MVPENIHIQLKESMYNSNEVTQAKGLESMKLNGNFLNG